MISEIYHTISLVSFVFQLGQPAVKYFHKIHRTLYIIILISLCVCDKQNNEKFSGDQTANLSEKNIEEIQKAKYIEEICHIDTVVIKMPVKDDAGYLKDILFTKDSLIVLAFLKSPNILIFDKSGNLIRRIGRRGAGPGI